MSVKVFDEPRIEELSGCRYRVQFVDGSGATLDAGAILGIEVTLTDVDTDAIVNERDAQDVLNANDGTLDPEGWFTFDLRAEDNAIMAPTQPGLIHGRRLTLRVRYRRADDVDDTLHHEARWSVVSLADAPLSDETGSP